MIKKRCLFALLCLIVAFSFIHSEENSEEESESVQAFPSQVFPPYAIINASYKGDEGMVRTILAAGVDKDVRDSLGATALHISMYQQNLNIVKMLLDYGFDPNVKDNKEHTPLYAAVVANNLAAARLLIRYGANKYARDLNGYTPLDRARKDEKSDMISLLSRS